LDKLFFSNYLSTSNEEQFLAAEYMLSLHVQKREVKKCYFPVHALENSQWQLVYTLDLSHSKLLLLRHL
jgi:hypothetical protein